MWARNHFANQGIAIPELSGPPRRGVPGAYNIFYIFFPSVVDRMTILRKCAEGGPAGGVLAVCWDKNAILMGDGRNQTSAKKCKRETPLRIDAKPGESCELVVKINSNKLVHVGGKR